LGGKTGAAATKIKKSEKNAEKGLIFGASRDIITRLCEREKKISE